MANSAVIKKLKAMVTKYEGMMVTLRELFKSDDGVIDSEEQKQLTTIQGYIDKVKAKIKSEETSNTNTTTTPDDKYEALAETPAVKEFLANIHKSEGGYVDDPSDPGGKTKYGIAEHREWPAFAKMHGLDPKKPELIKDITKKQVDEYYIKSRFEQNGLDKINSSKIVNALFDQSILTPGIIRKNMKRAVNDLGGHSFAANNSQFTPEEIKAINDADADKLVKGFVGYQNAYYEGLAKKKPKFQKYLKGWKNRTARLLGFNPKDDDDQGSGTSDNSSTTTTSGDKYVVVSGDTGYGIAKKLGLSFDELSAANPGVNWSKLSVGQEINKGKAGGGSSGGGKYVVVSGDTGYGIAKKLGISFDALSAANPGVNWGALSIGQELNKGAGSSGGNDNSNDDNTTKPDPTPTPSDISASVGAGGKNIEADVEVIQKLLKDKNYGIGVDGDCGPKTIAAIKKFQAAVFNGWSDGLISPGKGTWKKLISGEGVYDPNAPKTGVKKQLDDLINDEDPGKFLGIGADEDDEYKSQRDNEAVYLSNSKSGTFGNKIVGDIQCNVTSLSMMLIAMNGGDEDGVIEIVKEAIKKAGATPKSSWGIEELLAKYTDLQGHSVFSSSTMGKMAKKLMSTKLSKVETIWESQIKSAGLLNTIKDKILPALKEGAEVILSGKFTHGGHIVFLRSLKSDGPVINDPYGACLAIGKYMKNGDAASKNKSKFNTYSEELKRRLSINGLYSKVEKAIKENGTLPANLGQDNFYSWDDFAAINPYRFIITHKK